MSGGKWDYQNYDACHTLHTIGLDIELNGFSKLGKRIKKLSDNLSKILHDIDYHYCSNKEIKDLKKYEEKAIKRLQKVLE